MFLHLCVILFTGRGSVSGGGLHQGGDGGLCIGGGAASRGGSASGGGRVCIQGVGQTTPPPHRILWDTVNEQVVCILLECILVFMHVCLFISEVVPESPRINPTQTGAPPPPPPGAIPPGTIPPRDQTSTPPSRNHKSGWHALYWNAFLFPYAQKS